MTFSDSDARVAWNEGAVAWDAFVESGADYYRHEVHGPALLAICEPLKGQRVLDLGCGQGYFTRQLARRAAQVIGIDVADELIALATDRESDQQLGIDYRKLSAAAVVDHWAPGTFDLVAACMSLQDMANMRGALRGAFTVLRPGGRMVFSVPHPATDTAFREWERDGAGRKRYLKVDRYFETGPSVCRWSMPRLRYHWSTPCWRLTLSEWTAHVTDVGFAILRLQEPRPTAAQVAANPNLDDCRRVPFFLILDLWKPISPAAGAPA
jgi:SAM-dependent methyltransferase